MLDSLPHDMTDISSCHSCCSCHVEPSTVVILGGGAGRCPKRHGIFVLRIGRLVRVTDFIRCVI